MDAGGGAVGALVGLVATAVALTAEPEAVADVITIDRGWVAVALALFGTVGGAPWIITLIERREKRKLALATAGQADAGAADLRASVDLRNQQIVDSLFAGLERRIEDVEGDNKELRQEVKLLREQRRLDDVAAMAHGSWDFIVQNVVEKAGLTVPPCPPLRGSTVVPPG